jgi:predicted RNA binding protein YcfA (HicA-like mRNA interferase family)
VAFGSGARSVASAPEGWAVKRRSGSHRALSRAAFPDYVFPFHDSEEVGLRTLARIAKHTGLTPDDL